MAAATRTVKVRFDGEAKGLQQAAKDGESAVGKWKAGVAKVGAAAVAAAAIAGAAIGAALIAGMQKALDKSKTDALLAAQLGASGKTAGELGAASGRLYARGVVESIEEGNSAIRAAVQNGLAETGTAALDKVAARVSQLAKILEEDADRVSAAVSTLLRTGLAKSAEDAFDLLQVATEKGINKQQDLLDTFTEYSTLFRALGLDGPKAVGLLSQAIKAGARNSDQAADALKEFQLRAIDGSKLTASGFKRLGLDAKRMAKDIAAGGPSAAKALDLTLDRLRAIQDPVKRNAAAVELFGTKAEDMAAALFAMDPSKAVSDLGQVSGAADKAGKTLETNLGTKLDSIKRRLEVGITGAASAALGAIDKLAGDPEVREWADRLKADLQTIAAKWLPRFQESWDKVVKAFKDNKEQIGAVLRVLMEVGGFLVDHFIAGIERTIIVVGGLMRAFQFVADKALSVFGGIVKGAAAAFGWMGPLGADLKRAAGQFDTFAREVRKSLGIIPDQKTVTVKVKVSGSGAGVSGGKFATARAGGGPVDFSGGRRYLVGEDGPEILDMQTGTRGRVIPHGESMAMLAGPRPEAPIIVQNRIEIGGEVVRVVETRISAHDRRTRRRVTAGVSR